MAKGKDARPIVRLVSTAGTGYTYVTRKNRRNDPERMSLRKFASADPATPGYYRLDAPFMIVPQTEIVPTFTFPVAGDPKLCVRLEFDGVIIRKK